MLREIEQNQFDVGEVKNGLDHPDDNQNSNMISSLWVDKYSPHRYRELLSDHVRY